MADTQAGQDRPHSMGRKPARLWLGAVAAACVVTLWGVWECLTGDATLHALDILTFMAPHLADAGAQLAQGHLPVWTFGLGPGPLLFHPSAGVADFTTPLFAVWDWPVALGLARVAHAVVQQCTLLWVLKRLGVSPGPAAVAAVLWVGSGAVASSRVVALQDPTAVLLMVAAAVVTAQTRVPFRAVLAVTLAVAYRMLRPDPLMAAGGAVLMVVVAWTAAPPSVRAGRMVPLLTGGVLGGMVSAPFWVPALYVVVDSWRVSALAYPDAPLSLWRLLGSVAPGAMGVLGASGPNAGVYPLVHDQRALAHGFVGTGLWALLMASAPSWWRMQRYRSWAWLAAVMVAVAASAHAWPTRWLLEHLGVRFSDRLMLYATALLLMLGAAALQHVMRAARGRTERSTQVTLVLGALMLVGALPLANALAQQAASVHRQWMTAHLRDGVLLSAGCFLVVASATLARHRGWLSARAVVVVAAAVGTVDSLTCMATLNQTMPLAGLEPAHNALPIPPVGAEPLFSGSTRRPYTNVAVASPSAPDEETVRLRLALGHPLIAFVRGARYVASANLGVLEPARSAELERAILPQLPPGDAVALLAQLGAHRMLLQVDAPLGNVAGVETSSPLQLGAPGTWVDAHVVHPVPPVGLHCRWQTSGTPMDAALRLVQAHHANPLAAAVVAEGLAPPQANGQPCGTASVIRMQPGHWQVQVHTPSPALLVVRDAWAHGWEARVDGVAAPVHAVNVIHMGVPVGEANRTVVLRYTPPGLRAGLAVGLAGLALAALAAALFGRRKR